MEQQWTGKLLRDNAKLSVKRHYWMALLVCLVGSCLGSTANGGSIDKIGSVFSTLTSYISEWITGGSGIGTFDSDTIDSMLDVGFIILIVAIFIAMVGLLYYFLFSNLLIVGRAKYFLNARQQCEAFGDIFFPFQKVAYANIAKTMFLQQFLIWLWSLLFVIPGFIKSIEYCLVPYILAENPNISSKRALEISKKAMQGERMNVFRLWLSFFWIVLLLSCCCCGNFAAVLIHPWREATMAELWSVIRVKILNYGIASEMEIGSGIGIIPPTDSPTYQNPYDGI